MTYNDWNHNNRQDSFDRYMDYKSAHPEQSDESSSSDYSSDYDYDSDYDSDYDNEDYYDDELPETYKEEVPYYKNHPYEEKKQEIPYLAIAIVFVVGILVSAILSWLAR